MMYEGVYSNDPAQDELEIEFWGRFDYISERFAGTGDDPSADDYSLTPEEATHVAYNLLAAGLQYEAPTVSRYGEDDIPF